jgi:hypothetical protein
MQVVIKLEFTEWVFMLLESLFLQLGRGLVTQSCTVFTLQFEGKIPKYRFAVFVVGDKRNSS